MSKKPAIPAGKTPQPEKADPEIPAIEPEKLQENNNQTDLSPMETHADHLHKAPGKGVWHYVFEFLMLFLAVFCGFLAEYKLEHRIERDREKEFIVAAIKEMESDLYWINRFQGDSIRCGHLDTLSMLLMSSDRSQDVIRKIYWLYPSLKFDSYVIFKNTTMMQLKNSGNLRLIRNRSVVDSLIGLDAAYNGCNAVIEECREWSYDNVRQASTIYDAKYFDPNINWIRANADYLYKYPIKLLTTDETLLHTFSYNVKMQANKEYVYQKSIRGYKMYITRLVEYFKKEYHLD